MTPSPRRPTASAEAAENRHAARTLLTRYRVVRDDGKTMSGTPDFATAMRTLAVLSRDGELAGFRIVARGGR